MKTRSRKSAILALMVAVALLAAGCSSSDDDPTPEASATPTASPPPKTGAAIVDVTMTEYGYSISGPMQAGGTARVQNVGKEFHMIGLGQIEPGKELGDVISAFSKPGNPEAALEGIVKDITGPLGGTFGPGKPVEVTVPDLAPGNYVFMCFIPTVGEKDTSHAAKGMVADFAVAEETATAPTSDAKYQITPGQPISGPATLAPGKHVFEIDAAEGSSGLEPTLVKPGPGKSFADFDPAFEAIFGAEPPKAGYLDTFPGAVIFGLHDFEESRKIFVGVDLEPGTYEFNSSDSELKPEDKKNSKEKITIRVA